MTLWQLFQALFSRTAAGLSASSPRGIGIAWAIILVFAAGCLAPGYSGAAERASAKVGKAMAPAAALAPAPKAELPPPVPDLTGPLKQAMQDKFWEQAKSITAINENVDALGQQLRASEKSIQDLKAKQEETATRVYEFQSRDIAGFEKLEDLSGRLGQVESKLAISQPHPPKAVATVPAPPAASPSPTEFPSSATQTNRAESAGWLVAALLVFSLPLGFTLLEMSRLENWALPQVGLRNLVVVAVVALAYFAVGQGVMFGFEAAEANAVSAEAFQLYHLGLALVPPLLVAMILSDRLSLPAYGFIALLLGGLAYPLLGNWAWGGEWLPERVGWLERLGFQDFAGASVIHSFAASFALAWVWRFPTTRLLGPTDAHAEPNQSFVPLALSILWLGWFGLSAGRQDAYAHPAAPLIVNTLLAGAAALLASLASLLTTPAQAGQDAFARLAAGTIAGLVGISACVQQVVPTEAIAIGAMAGLLHPLAYRGLAATLLRHDQVAANLLAAHGVCGIFGTLCVALFGNPGAFTLPDFGQLGIQAVGAGAALGLGLAVGLLGALSWEGFSRFDAIRLARPAAKGAS